jgi:hypothetical protein
MQNRVESQCGFSAPSLTASASSSAAYRLRFAQTILWSHARPNTRARPAFASKSRISCSIGCADLPLCPCGIETACRYEIGSAMRSCVPCRARPPRARRWTAIPLHARVCISHRPSAPSVMPTATLEAGTATLESSSPLPENGVIVV